MFYFAYKQKKETNAMVLNISGDTKIEADLVDQNTKKKPQIKGSLKVKGDFTYNLFKASGKLNLENISKSVYRVSFGDPSNIVVFYANELKSLISQHKNYPGFETGESQKSFKQLKEPHAGISWFHFLTFTYLSTIESNNCYYFFVNHTSKILSSESELLLTKRKISHLICKIFPLNLFLIEFGFNVQKTEQFFFNIVFDLIKYLKIFTQQEIFNELIKDKLSIIIALILSSPSNLININLNFKFISIIIIFDFATGLNIKLVLRNPPSNKVLSISQKVSIKF